MKIAHVTQFLGVGGLEKVIFLLAKEQMAQGHEVELYVYDYDRSWVDYFRKNGITVITPPLKRPGYDIELLAQLNQYIKKFDIVHTHDLNPLMYLGPLRLKSRLFRFSAKPKLVHSTHGLGHVEVSKKARLYEKAMAPMADAIIGVAEHVCDFYNDQTIIPKKRIFQIDNGIFIPETNLWKNKANRDRQKKWICQRHQLDSELPLFVCIARVVPLKNQLFLMKNLKRYFPQCQLLVIGPCGDEDYFQALKQEQTNHIQVIGARQDINRYLEASDLFLSASTHEGIPMAVLEAMAHGLPSLVSDIEGHHIINTQAKDFVVHLFPLGDDKAFCHQLQFLLDNPLAAKDLSTKSYFAVQSHFSATKMAAMYQNIYENNEIIH